MSQMEKPKLMRVIKSDYFANLAVKIPTIFWIILLVALFMNLTGGTGRQFISFDKQSSMSLLYLSIGATVLATPLLYWRYRYFSALFAAGKFSVGKVVNVVFRGSRGYVEYTYTRESQEMRSFNSLFKNDRTRSLKVNDPVTVILDEKNPKKTYIRELFV